MHSTSQGCSRAGSHRWCRSLLWQWMSCTRPKRRAGPRSTPRPGSSAGTWEKTRQNCHSRTGGIYQQTAQHGVTPWSWRQLHVCALNTRIIWPLFNQNCSGSQPQASTEVCGRPWQQSNSAPLSHCTCHLTKPQFLF